VTADGRTLVFVHRSGGNFHIAAQDLKRGNVRILSDTRLDESPSVSPNGTMVLYATETRGQGILAAVSIDGRVRFRIPATEGDVREPAWSPLR
jgi:TolB protein